MEQKVAWKKVPRRVDLKAARRGGGTTNQLGRDTKAPAGNADKWDTKLMSVLRSGLMGRSRRMSTKIVEVSRSAGCGTFVRWSMEVALMSTTHGQMYI